MAENKPHELGFVDHGQMTIGRGNGYVLADGEGGVCFVEVTSVRGGVPGTRERITFKYLWGLISGGLFDEMEGKGSMPVDEFCNEVVTDFRSESSMAPKPVLSVAALNTNHCEVCRKGFPRETHRQFSPCPECTKG